MCTEIASHNGFEAVSNRVESVDQRRIGTRNAPKVRKQGLSPCGNSQAVAIGKERARRISFDDVASRAESDEPPTGQHQNIDAGTHARSARIAG
jgi:hypothetical protein